MQLGGVIAQADLLNAKDVGIGANNSIVMLRQTSAVTALENNTSRVSFGIHWASAGHVLGDGRETCVLGVVALVVRGFIVAAVWDVLVMPSDVCAVSVAAMCAIIVIVVATKLVNFSLLLVQPIPRGSFVVLVALVRKVVLLNALVVLWPRVWFDTAFNQNVYRFHVAMDKGTFDSHRVAQFVLAIIVDAILPFFALATNIDVRFGFSQWAGFCVTPGSVG